MKHNLFLSMLAAVLMGSGVANADDVLYASDYTSGCIELGAYQDYGTLVVDEPLTLAGERGYLDLYNGATFEFLADNSGAICSISTSSTIAYSSETVFFCASGDYYNFTFNESAQAIIAASAGTPITLIQDLDMDCHGFMFYSGQSPSETTLTLNGAGYGETVSMGGVQFTYVGPKEDGYNFQTGEIGFKGYYDGSHALNLAHGGGIPTPEPTTGSLSLLALAGLCARRRKK